MLMNSNIVKPERVIFPLFEMISCPKINMSTIKHRRFPEECPICKQYFSDILDHAMKETDILHGIYVIHNS